jgi:hypothetical protein
VVLFFDVELPVELLESRELSRESSDSNSESLGGPSSNTPSEGSLPVDVTLLEVTVDIATGGGYVGGATGGVEAA